MGVLIRRDLREIAAVTPERHRHLPAGPALMGISLNYKKPPLPHQRFALRGRLIGLACAPGSLPDRQIAIPERMGIITGWAEAAAPRLIGQARELIISLPPSIDGTHESACGMLRDI